MVRLLTLILMFSTSSWAGFQEELSIVNDLRGSLNKKVATFYAGSCKENKSTDLELNKLENIYFPLAAKKYKNINKCELIALSKLRSESYNSSFIKKVVTDIAIKINSLRKLKAEIDNLSSQIEDLEAENFADDAQLSRFGYLSEIDRKRRQDRIAIITDLQRTLSPKLVTYDLIYSSIWRSKSPSMSVYIDSIIDSNLTPAEFKNKALKNSPGFIESYWQGNFSFLDEAISPMIEDAQNSIDLISSQTVATKNGFTFIPNFSTRQVLVSNMDLLYSSNNPSQTFKSLSCHLDQKYVSGDSALKKTLSVASLFAGTSAKVIPYALRLARLEKLVEGSTYIARVTSFLATTSTVIGLESTVQSAYESCHSQLEYMISGKDNCSSTSTVSDIDNYEYRKLSKGNCALSIVAGLLSTVGADSVSNELTDVLGKNPEMAKYLSQISSISQTAAKVTEKALDINDKTSVTKDFIDLMMVNKSKSEPEPKR